MAKFIKLENRQKGEEERKKKERRKVVSRSRQDFGDLKKLFTNCEWKSKSQIDKNDSKLFFQRYVKLSLPSNVKNSILILISLAKTVSEQCLKNYRIQNQNARWKSKIVEFGS